jgi:hypothetical protein
LKTGWINARDRAGVEGRLHDSRHTLITELAESGAVDQTIMDIAGHVSRQMLKHYSHIRMKAKREALEAVWKKQQESIASEGSDQTNAVQDCSQEPTDARKVEGESLQSGASKGTSHRGAGRKSLMKRFGSPSQTKGILRTRDTGKMIDLEWLTQMARAAISVSPDSRMAARFAPETEANARSLRQVSPIEDDIARRAQPLVSGFWQANGAG